MIDGIKVMRLPNSVEEINSNPAIDILGFFNFETGEVQDDYKKFASHRHLDLTLYPTNRALTLPPTYRIELNGSLHKFYKGENYSDFNIIQINDTIDELAEELLLNPSDTILNNVEYGINLELSYPVSRLLNAIINYKSTPFSPMSKTIVKNGQGIEVGLEQYYIKIYDKGFQSNLDINLVRIEVKVVKMKYFKNKQVRLRTLADLKNPEIYTQLKSIFIDILKDILICEQDVLASQNIAEKEQLVIANGCNPKYWENLKGKYKDLDSGSTQYQKLKRKYYYQAALFSKLIDKYKLEKLKLDLIDAANVKCDELINPQKISPSSETRLPMCTNSPTLKDIGSKQKCTNSQGVIKEENVHNHTIVKLGICTKGNSPRKCKITGADISDQKPTSKFVNDKKAGGHLQAKRIRNMDSNPRNKLKERIMRPTRQPTLFDIMNEDIVHLTKEQRDALGFWEGTPYEVHLKPGKYNNTYTKNLNHE